VEDIYDAAHNYVAPPTETQLIDGLVAGGSELLSQDGRVVRMGVLGFTCKVRFPRPAVARPRHWADCIAMS
jgi:hypothetical protein